MKHLQPYYKKAIRQILAENDLSQKFSSDTLYAALCSGGDSRKAVKMILELFAAADFDWPKLDFCRKLADEYGLPQYQKLKVKDKYNFLIQGIMSRANNIRQMEDAKNKPSPSFIWVPSVATVSKGDDILAEIVSRHYPLPELPPFFPGDMSTISLTMKRQ